jgi:E3 UFM1-protein ligase 1
MMELQKLLNIDISHIEAKINEIFKNDSNLTFITGQILSKDYMNKISEEINDILQEKGNILISDLSNQYELPIEFFTQVLFLFKLTYKMRI